MAKSPNESTPDRSPQPKVDLSSIRCGQGTPEEEAHWKRTGEMLSANLRRNALKDPHPKD
ncbi:MAG: hypothetical protein IT348_09030 [Candidatus Eisenbacteria bacterium]|nr:hypothetical protein [Candidatus Eisenbacteria bacterium]